MYHHGLFNSTFITPFLSMVGMTSEHDSLWRGKVVEAARRVLNTPRLHKKFATMNGESSIGIMKAALRLHHDPYPWDDLWRSVAVEHQVRDAWWDERNVLPLLEDVTIPVYLGCDWENVPLHLPGTFEALEALDHNDRVRVAMLGQFGLTWPWESLHVEALAWFDQWLKDRDTGILEGPPIRYWLPVADEWRTSEYLAPAGICTARAGPLRRWLPGEGGQTTGSREYLTSGGGTEPGPGQPDRPAAVPHLDDRSTRSGVGRRRQHGALARCSEHGHRHRLDPDTARRRSRWIHRGHHRGIPSSVPSRD